MTDQHLVLVIDTSGSMGNQRLVQAKQYSHCVIKNHKSHTIWGFSDTPREYSDVDSLRASGGTKIALALNRIFQTLKRGDYMILITDAEDDVSESEVKSQWVKLKEQGVAGEAMLLGNGGGATDVLKRIFATKIVKDNELSTYVEKMSMMHNKAHKAQEEVAQVKQELAATLKTQQVTEAKMIEMKKMVQKKQEEYTAINNELKETEDEFGQMMSTHFEQASQKAKLAETKDDLERVKQDIADCRKILDDYVQKSRVVTEKLEKQEHELEQQQEEMEQHEENLKQAEEKTKQYQIKHDEIDGQIAELRSTVPDSQKLPGLIEQAKQLLATISKLNIDKTILEAKVAELEEYTAQLERQLFKNIEENKQLLKSVETQTKLLEGLADEDDEDAGKTILLKIETQTKALDVLAQKGKEAKAIVKKLDGVMKMMTGSGSQEQEQKEDEFDRDDSKESKQQPSSIEMKEFDWELEQKTEKILRTVEQVQQSHKDVTRQDLTQVDNIKTNSAKVKTRLDLVKIEDDIAACTKIGDGLAEKAASLTVKLEKQEQQLAQQQLAIPEQEKQLPKMQEQVDDTRAAYKKVMQEIRQKSIRSARVAKKKKQVLNRIIKKEQQIVKTKNQIQAMKSEIAKWQAQLTNSKAMMQGLVDEMQLRRTKLQKYSKVAHERLEENKNVASQLENISAIYSEVLKLQPQVVSVLQQLDAVSKSSVADSESEISNHDVESLYVQVTKQEQMLIKLNEHFHQAKRDLNDLSRSKTTKTKQDKKLFVTAQTKILEVQKVITAMRQKIVESTKKCNAIRKKLRKQNMRRDKVKSPRGPKSPVRKQLNLKVKVAAKKVSTLSPDGEDAESKYNSGDDSASNDIKKNQRRMNKISKKVKKLTKQLESIQKQLKTFKNDSDIQNIGSEIELVEQELESCSRQYYDAKNFTSKSPRSSPLASPRKSPRVKSAKAIQTDIAALRRNLDDCQRKYKKLESRVSKQKRRVKSVGEKGKKGKSKNVASGDEEVL